MSITVVGLELVCSAFQLFLILATVARLEISRQMNMNGRNQMRL